MTRHVEKDTVCHQIVEENMRIRKDRPDKYPHNLCADVVNCQLC